MTKIKQVPFGSVENLQLTEKRKEIQPWELLVGRHRLTFITKAARCVTSVQQDQIKNNNMAADEGELMHIIAVKKT